VPDLSCAITPNEVSKRIRSCLATIERLLEQDEQLTNLARILAGALSSGRKVLLFGNGGSAADAQHIAAEFAGRFYIDRAALPALALTTNTSSLTAIGNDYGFQCVFARQVEALGSVGDIAIGISTSGSSPNVLEGLRAAKRKGMVTAGLTGKGGGLLVREADHCICVPSDDTPRIQEAHILIGHILCELVEQALFGGADGQD